MLFVRLASLLLLPLLVASRSAAEAPSTAATAPQELRLFVCGHSFMIFTARALPPIARAAGVPLAMAGQQMLGGSRVIQHWNLPDERNRAKEALRAGQVDVLTLSPHVLLPDEGIDNFTRLGLEKNPSLRVLVQASWLPLDGHPPGVFRNEQRDAVTVQELAQMRTQHREGWLVKLEAQVRELNRQVGRETVHIIPVFEAVLALRERVVQGQAPGVARQSELFRDPLGHPQPVLALLITYCHFAAIFQRSPEGIPAPAEMAALPQGKELNSLLQQLAWRAVSTYPLSGVKSAATARSR